MMIQPYLQKLGTAFTFALIVTLGWTTLVYADDPGDLDLTFGGTGVVTTSVGSNAFAGEIALQPDGKIVMAGGNEAGLVVLRYNDNGSLDTTFNHTGIVVTNIDSDTESGGPVKIQPDGKIVVAGCKGAGVGTKHEAFLVRYTAQGALDSSFNHTGIVTNDFCGWEIGVDLAQQTDGKSVMVSTALQGSSFDPEGAIAIARYTVSGTMDTTLNNTGILTTRIQNQDSWSHHAVLQPDNKIIVAGGFGDTLALFRYTTAGTLDSTFNGTGIVTITNPNISQTVDGTSLVLQPDGKIMVGFTFVSNGNYYLMFRRYHNNGTPDLDFGSGTGFVTTLVGYFGSHKALAIQPNGKIIASGYRSTSIADKTDFMLIRYRPDGRLDTTFNSSGIVTTPIGDEDSYSYGLALQSDGKIVVSGQTGSGKLAVARYLGEPALPSIKTYLPLCIKDL